MKYLRIYLLFCLALTYPAWAAEQAEGADTTDAPRVRVTYLSETPEQLKGIEQNRSKLETQKHPVDLKDALLGDVIEELSKVSGLDFIVNWPALEIVGIDEDSLITYRSEQGNLVEHLTRVLAIAGADAFDDDKPGYDLTASGVEISTKRDLNEQTVLRMYNIGALLREPYRPVGTLYSTDAFAETISFHAWLRGERRYPMTDAFMLDLYKKHLAEMMVEVGKLDPENVVEPAEEQDNGGGRLFGDDNIFGRREPGEHLHPAIEELTELIKNSTGDQDQWFDQESTINVKGDQLIIRANRGVHREVEQLLSGLLEAEIQKQADVLRDAHASKQVAMANDALEIGEEDKASGHIDRALRIMPDHIPARAMRRMLDAMQQGAVAPPKE